METISGYLEAFGIVVASAILFYQNRKQSKKIGKVEQNLTTSNGGSHVKDHLLNIEKRQEIQDERLALINKRINRLDARIGRALRIKE